MIIIDGKKINQIYKGDQRVYMIYHGKDLIYNPYLVIEDVYNEDVYELTLNNEGYAYVHIYSNSEWVLDYGEPQDPEPPKQ